LIKSRVKMKETSFIFPIKAKHLTLSNQTITRLINAMISYNFGESHSYIFQHLFIDFDTVQWVAEKILDNYVYRVYCHPLLIKQVLKKLNNEILCCHRELKITRKDKKMRISEFSQAQIISSIQKLYLCYSAPKDRCNFNKILI